MNIFHTADVGSYAIHYLIDILYTKRDLCAVYCASVFGSSSFELKQTAWLYHYAIPVLGFFNTSC